MATMNMPMPDMPAGDDENDEATALGKALDQIRDLLDQIETQQVSDKMKPNGSCPECGGVGGAHEPGCSMGGAQ